MINSAKHSLLLATLLGLSASALAQTPGVDMKGTVGYAIDQRGFVVKSGTGLCWRTGYWTPAMAVEECDPDLVKKAEPAPKSRAVAAAPAAAPKPAAQKVTLAADALFDFNKADLRAEGKAKLDKLAGDIKGIKLEVIIAVGHADRFGTDAYNQKLSEKRAESVKAYLVSKGIEPNRVYTEGKGEKQPITKPDQCKGPKSKKVIDCLQPDRRVEIEVIGTKAQ
ncbi:OmpA family protein [Sulfuritalea hydrogenivorans]|jgi:OOP family OmpA-OmpF porin|uniref:Outer membrane protein/peptidoglycan-associated (Lipo)protein n=1 Tax=Sulfuritalea hydrogenivorans sk43H TaxID=1223802 RepID=W0SIR8_9PROT|nr:outer membrane protein/peptidoglycan-associated (lipo)protein [Sulfuritalea hydrogenivorans sk43H]